MIESPRLEIEGEDYSFEDICDLLGLPSDVIEEPEYYSDYSDQDDPYDYIDYPDNFRMRCRNHIRARAFNDSDLFTYSDDEIFDNSDLDMLS